MKLFRHLTLLLSVALAATGCSEADIEPPVLSDLLINPTPSAEIICGEEDPNVIVVSTGDSITLSFNVSDNEALSQYKVDLHQNFDCHGHSKVETTVWEVIDIVSLEGTFRSVSHTLRVPDSATAGTYHFDIQVADFFGNSVRSQRFGVIVRNLEDTVAPALSLTEPTSSDLVISITDTLPNDSIRFMGSVNDNRNLEDGGNGRLNLRYWRVGSPNIFDMYSILFVPGTGPVYPFDFKVAIPIALVTGDYVLELRAFDGVNNAAVPQRFNLRLE